MVQSLPYLKETPSQTAGPYVHIGLIPHQAGFEIFQHNFSNVLIGPKTKGERIIVEGRVFDGTGTPVRDALLEIWQANADGRYNHSADTQAKPLDGSFRGWGRTGSDFKTGIYTFETVKPGPVDTRRGKLMAPHINFWIVARGINIGLSTRMYFSDESDSQRRRSRPQFDRAGTPAADADRREKQPRRQGRLHVRHSPAGRERDRVLRRLRNGRPMRAELVRKYAAPVPRYTSYGAALLSQDRRCPGIGASAIGRLLQGYVQNAAAVTAPAQCALLLPSIFGSVSKQWKGGGEDSVHSSVVAPSPQGLSAACTLRWNASAMPAKKTSSAAAEM